MVEFADKLSIYIVDNDNVVHIGRKNWVVPLVIRERKDVGEYFQNEKYKLCGFESYMPATIINNWKHIKRVELIIKNHSIHSVCGRKILFIRSENNNWELT